MRSTMPMSSKNSAKSKLLLSLLIAAIIVITGASFLYLRGTAVRSSAMVPIDENVHRIAQEVRKQMSSGRKEIDMESLDHMRWVDERGEGIVIAIRPSVVVVLSTHVDLVGLSGSLRYCEVLSR